MQKSQKRYSYYILELMISNLKTIRIFFFLELFANTFHNNFFWNFLLDFLLKFLVEIVLYFFLEICYELVEIFTIL